MNSPNKYRVWRKNYKDMSNNWRSKQILIDNSNNKLMTPSESFFTSNSYMKLLEMIAVGIVLCDLAKH